MSAHPTYPNPQLVEALCEFHLRLAATDPWKPSKPGAFFQAVQELYPEIEPVTQQGVQLIIGPDNVPQQQLLPPRISFRLKHRERPILLQISEQILTINALRPYLGWDHVKAELKGVWPLVLDIIKPEAITRIGMRYINRVTRRTADESPGYWLQPSEYVPASLLESGPGYQLRLQTRLAEHDRFILTIAHDETDKKELHGAMLFDIDRINQDHITTAWSEIDGLLEILHEDVWRIFDAAKGPKLNALLEGRLR